MCGGSAVRRAGTVAGRRRLGLAGRGKCGGPRSGALEDAGAGTILVGCRQLAGDRDRGQSACARRRTATAFRFAASASERVRPPRNGGPNRTSFALAVSDKAIADLPAILALAKLGHLLPAVLIGRLAPAARDPGMLGIRAGEVLNYPRAIGRTLHRVSEASVALAGIGTTRVVSFRPADGSVEHLAIVIGQPQDQTAPLVRIHSECFTGDLLASLRCDCGPQLHASLHAMAEEGHGVVLYMAQEGRGIGLPNKLRAYLLQDGEGQRPQLDTLDANHALGWEADERDFAPAAAMLRSLNIRSLRLMTNNPVKLAVLAAEGISIVGQEPNRIAPNGVNDAYLSTKRARFGHSL
jgi:GTP cyclohydrolase II